MGMSMPHLAARITAARAKSGVAVLLLVGCMGTACSSAPTRSVKNFCATYTSEKAKFLRTYGPLESQPPANESASSVFSNLILGMQSLGDVSIIFDKLDKAAPDDIEPDVAAVRDSWKSMQGTLGDEASNAFNPKGLVGALLKGLLASAESGGSWTRLGQYVQTNCPGA